MTLKNTKDCATIVLVSSNTADGETNKTEYTMEGGFYERNGIYYITYKEYNEQGMGDSTVFLKIADKEVTMRRMGEFSTVMNYDLGKVTEFIYRTPFGTMDIKIKTKVIDKNLSASGGTLKLVYSLFIGGECSSCELDLKVEKKEGTL